MRTISLDHIALAMARMSDAPALLVGELGGRPAYGARSKFYTFGQWRFKGGGRLEVLEPLGADGFLRRFLESHGPGVHHVTFKVPDLGEACARAEAQGYSIVGYDDSDPEWKEAFLHPKQAQGIVVQLAQTTVSGEETLRDWQPPAAPPDPPPPVRLLGLLLRAHTIGRARTQWEAVLQGEASEGPDGELVYRWPLSPLRIAVEVDPLRDEGPIAIEVESDRPLALTPGPHPILGTVIRGS